MASVREIAQEIGVSVATVSRALNSQPGVSVRTRERVMKAANVAGYKGAAARRNAVSIGFALLGDMQLFDYDWLLLEGIRKGLNDSKLDVQVIDVQRDKADDETYTQFFVRRGLRGVILRTNHKHRRTCEAIATECFPSVVVAERFDSPEINFVSCDSTAATARGVEHLIQLGHQHIAMAVNRGGDRDHMDRVAGYKQALEANGIAFEPELLTRIAANLEGGANALNELMSRRTPPTAICFADPEPSVGAICRASEIGLRLPEDLSILGFDDGKLRHMVRPVMSAVCQDTREIGREAASWLGDCLLQEHFEPLQRVFQASLVINQTTGAPPSHPVQIQPDGSPINH